MPSDTFTTKQTNNSPIITFGPELLCDAGEALWREWLVTNGLGGYASATLATANTRRYHGLLVAALTPPCGRAVLLSKLEETLTITDAQGEETAYQLSANVYPGAIYPQGYTLLTEWRNDPTPTWTWQPASGLQVEKRVNMVQGQNTTLITYRLLNAPEGAQVRLSLVPLLAWRDYHSEMAACDFRPVAIWAASTLQLRLPPIPRVTDAPTTLQLCLRDANDVPISKAQFEPRPDWYCHFQHPREQERGQDFQEDLYTPGTLSMQLTPGQSVVVVASTEAQPLASGQREDRETGRGKTANHAKQTKKKGKGKRKREKV